MLLALYGRRIVRPRGFLFLGHHPVVLVVVVLVIVAVVLWQRRRH